MRSGLIKGVVGSGDWRTGKAGSSSSGGGGNINFDSPTVVEDELVLDLRFNDGSGTTLTDYSVSGRNGTLESSPLWLEDSLAGLSFQVSDSDHITFPTANYVTSGNLTIEMVYRLTTNPEWARIVDFGDITTPGSNFFFTPNFNNTGFPAFGVVTGSETLTISAIPSTLTDWGYWTVTLSSGTVKMYRNNVQVAQGSAFTPINASRSPNYIGRSNFAGNSYLDGAIAMVRLYNKALSKAERCANFSQSVLWLLSQGIKV
jgi:hypothetical protein